MCKVKGISSHQKTRSGKNASEDLIASTSETGHLSSPFPESPTTSTPATSNTTRSFTTTSYHSLTVGPTSARQRYQAAAHDLPCLNSIKKKGSLRLDSFRRAWSDINLENLVCTSCDQEEFRNSTTTPNKFKYRYHKSMLISSLSLSIFHKNEGAEDEERNEVDMGREDELMRTITIGENIESTGCGDFTFGEKSMGLIEEEGEDKEQGSDGIESFDIEEVKDPGSPLMYLASGLGIDDIDFSGDSGGGGYHSSFPNFEERCDVEEYYKRMIDEYPCHPSLLSSYAGFLQSKGELHKAEEYYHLATLADPADSKILMQYAKLEWELHHDQGRALVNFERAVQAAPQNSHVLAAYASFLWEIEDDGEEDTSKPESLSLPGHKFVKLPSELNIDVEDNAESDANKGGNDEEYYERMIEENPCNSLVLRNYAEFLYQSKRDLKGAEEYYGRAILADPSDGKILSQYAKLMWELHHDHDKASSFFDQAVQATPSDSNVLAAYASFLWETEEIEEDNTSQFQIPNHYEGAAAAANA